jgi:cell surface protein SprA
MTNLKHFGRTTSYNHYINATYNVPINKLPGLSWVTANARFGADYSWLAGALYPDSMDINLGNAIKNTRLTLSGDGTSLACTANRNSSKWKTTPGRAVRRMQTEYKTVVFTRNNVNFRPDVMRPLVHNLRTRDVQVKITRKDGTEVKGNVEIISDNRVNFTTSEAVEGTLVTIEGKIPKKRNPMTVTGEYMLRAMMGIRSVSMTYTSSQGQFLPGFLPEANSWAVQDQQCYGPGLPVMLD